MFEIDQTLPKRIISEVAASKEITQVAFVGCGASMSELYPAKYFMTNNAKKLAVSLYTANEFNYDTPAWLGEHTLVITCSLGGGTKETVAANKVAKAHGATVIAITHKAGSPLTEGVDYAIVHGFEANYAAKCEKMGYALALANEVLEQIEGESALYVDMCEGLAKVYDLLESAAQSAGKAAEEFAEGFKDNQIIYYMASGASAKVAYSTSAFLMQEMQWIDSGSFHTGEFFHGPFELTDPDHNFVLYMSEGATRELDARALTFLQRFGAHYTVVDAKDYGLANAVPQSVITYFNPLLHTAVFRRYAEAIAAARQHPLTKRRYMWKLEY